MRVGPSCSRQPQGRAQAAERTLVELERASINGGKLSDNREPQAGAGFGAALLKPHKAFDHARAVGFRDAGTTVRNRKDCAIALHGGANHDFRRRVSRPIWSCVFDGVIDQVRQSLTDQFTIAANRRFRRRFNL